MSEADDSTEIEIPGMEAAIKEIERRLSAPDFTKASVVMKHLGYEGLPGGRAAIAQAEERESRSEPGEFTNLLRQDKYEHQPIQQPTESID